MKYYVLGDNAFVHFKWPQLVVTWTTHALPYRQRTSVIFPADVFFFWNVSLPSTKLWYWPCGSMERGYKLTTCNQPLQKRILLPEVSGFSRCRPSSDADSDCGKSSRLFPFKPPENFLLRPLRRFHNTLEDIRRWCNFHPHPIWAIFFFLLAFMLCHQSQSL